MIINGVSACWSGRKYHEAIEKLAQGTVEPIFGILSTEHVQLCPQHADFITSELLDSLMEKHPDIAFRLHSDVRTKKKIGYTMDACDYNNNNAWYFKDLAAFSKQLDAPLYSLHAGKRSCSLPQVFDNIKALCDIFDCDVAVEGHYPFKDSVYLIDSWKEYEALLRSGISYALDLSHLNIVATREGWQMDLTQEMLSAPQCKEIHLSFNEGKQDNHIIGHDTYNGLWSMWKPMVQAANSDAAIFSEGNQVLELMRIDRAQKQNIA